MSPFLALGSSLPVKGKDLGVPTTQPLWET
jgi:hypothetical protein